MGDSMKRHTRHFLVAKSGVLLDISTMLGHPNAFTHAHTILFTHAHKHITRKQTYYTRTHAQAHTHTHTSTNTQLGQPEMLSTFLETTTHLIPIQFEGVGNVLQHEARRLAHCVWLLLGRAHDGTHHGTVAYVCTRVCVCVCVCARARVRACVCLPMASNCTLYNCVSCNRRAHYEVSVWQFICRKNRRALNTRLAVDHGLRRSNQLWQRSTACTT